MPYINYLDFPSPPAELLESVETILGGEKKIVYIKDFFQLRAASDDLIKWCNDNIKDVPFLFRAQYRIFGHGIPIHRDRALNGKSIPLTFNYLLDCGGSDVSTTIYDDQGRILETQIIKPLRWHSIKVDMLHGLHGLMPGCFRVALNLAPIPGLADN